MRYKNSRFSILDGLLLLLLVSFCGFIIYRMFWGMNYKWNWSIIPSYLIYSDPATGSLRANSLLQGFIITIKLSIWGMLLATLVGFITGLFRTSPRLFFRLLGNSYVSIIRNTPPLVLVFIFYYFISDQLFTLVGFEDFIRGLNREYLDTITFLFTKPELLTPFLSGTLTLALFQGAYIGEIVRAGIQAVDTGQWEASSALGLSRFSQMRDIIMPQAIRTMLPPLANEFINTIKWSSIVSIISIQELTFQGMQIMASTQATLEIWITITAMYLVLCLLLSYAVGRIEKHLADPEQMKGLTV